MAVSVVWVTDMPTPSEGEEQSHFISRCVRQVMGEGKEQKAALGQCYGVWRQHRGRSGGTATPARGSAKLFSEVMKQQPGIGAVHAQTAIGNAERRRRQQRRQAIMDAAARVKKPGEQDEGAGDTDIGTEKTWSIPLEIKKAEPERQMIFGWASVVKKNGEYIVDKQGDIIPVDELENAVLNYMLESREHGVQHAIGGTGQLVMSFLTTPEYMKAFGLTQQDGLEGWIAGYKIDDPELWEAHKRGILPDFSIGGSSIPFEPVEDIDLPTIMRGMDKARDRRLARKPFR